MLIKPGSNPIRAFRERFDEADDSQIVPRSFEERTNKSWNGPRPEAVSPGPVFGPKCISLKPDKSRARCREEPTESPAGLRDKKFANISNIMKLKRKRSVNFQGLTGSTIYSVKLKAYSSPYFKAHLRTLS